MRCEADHRDGGVCIRRLNRSGECPAPSEHAPRVMPQHPCALRGHKYQPSWDGWWCPVCDGVVVCT